MRALNVSVSLTEDTPLLSQPFLSPSSGRVLGSLDVGECEVVVMGSPAALRRLALEAAHAAEDAEKLTSAVSTVERELVGR
jgi:hypothetical protein